MGVVTHSKNQQIEVGTHLGTRLSWASVHPNRKNKLDVGIGYELDSFLSPSAQPKVHNAYHRQASKILHGPTVDASYRVNAGKHWRQWVGGRLEMPMRTVSGETYAGVGGSIRMSAEFFGVAKGRNALGSFGLGGYIETGARYLPGGARALTTGAGLSVRLPLAAF